MSITAEALDNTAVPNFYNALGATARAALGATINGTLIPIEGGSAGNFAYNYLSTNGNNQFNFWTFQYISALAQAGSYPGTASLNSGANAFTAGNQQLTNQILFALSPADQQALTNAMNATELQQLNVITTYEGQFGAITAADIADARLWLAGGRTKLNYIVSFIVGGLWAGKTSPPGLSWTKMRTAPRLTALLPEAPAGSASTIGAIVLYLNAMGPITSLADQQSLGSSLIEDVKVALLDPINTGAGMVTFNPTNAADTKNVAAWSIGKTMQAIQNELNGSSKITMEITLTQVSESVYNVDITGGTRFQFGGPFLTFNAGASTSYDMTSIQGSGKKISINVTYNGYATVPVAPQALIPSSGSGPTGATGWYFPRMIAEANANRQLGPNAPTGFNFINPPSVNLSAFPEGGFNTLTTLLISNYPSISINYEEGDFKSFAEVFKAQASGGVRNYGIPIGSTSMSTYSSKLQSEGTNQKFSVSFAPPATTGVGTSQQTAYMIGSVIGSPGALVPTTGLRAERLAVSKERSLVEELLETL
jgi:hypothetical protein